MLFSKNLKKLSGFSLLELLLSIAIIGLIILMATRYFTTVKSGQQASAAIQQITAIRAATASQAAQGATTISSATICASLPQNSCTAANNLTFPWDTAGSGSSSYSYTGPTYTVTVASIPTAAACQSILSAFQSSIISGTPTCTTSAYSSLVLNFTTAN